MFGKATDYNTRMSYYKNNFHKKQTKLYNATQKYGWNNFIFGEIIEYCKSEILNKR